MADNVWHALNTKEVLKLLNTSLHGLSAEEAKKRLNEYGYNELKKEEKTTPLKIFLHQFKSYLIFILIIATIVSIAIGELADAAVILLILLANAFLGFFQEYKAEKAVDALKKMTSPKAVVIRDGKKIEILSRELVPGDVVFIEAGMQVPADIRLFETYNLKIDESVLTGESLPVAKFSKVLSKDVQISDMKNIAFMGTNVVQGYGKGIVVKTGMETEMGKIAGMVQEEEKETTPLKKRLNELGKQLGIVILVVIAFVFLLNLYLGRGSVVELFMLSVALAISSVPEGLPMVVTLALALGMQAMAKEKAIVRKLMAVETLGAADVICTDKTGTITKNEMTVTDVYVDNKYVEVSGRGYSPVGEFKVDGKNYKSKSLDMLLKISALCNNASVVKEDKYWKVIGDPTEGALITLAKKGKIEPEVLKKKLKFLTELPFSSERKMMSVVYEDDKKMAYMKGAPERVIPRCDRIMINGKIKKLSKEEKNKLQEISEKMAGKPLRVLAFAFKIIRGKNYIPKEVETNLIFVGFAGMIDPPREGVKEAIKKCHEAGIRVVMITGDHKTTAVAIAKSVGIMNEGDTCITGEELESMDLKELSNVVERTTVFARVSPSHKVRILEALELHKHTVAMTGDGVNDAPALKRASIGVAMGIKGTDVARQASDMILEDDNFSTIVKAIESGRRIYDNIKKFVRFELSSNFDEIALISFAAIAGLPLPLLPLQLLWVNLVTDTIPATALAVDPPEKDIMKRPPRKKGKFVIGMLPYLLMVMIVFTFVDIWLFLWGFQFGVERARTLVFTSDVIFQLFLVFNMRAERKPFVSINPFKNKYLVLGVIIAFLLQLGVVYLPPLQAVFGTVALDSFDWLVVFLFGLLGLALSPNLFKKWSEKFE
jgi:Ca2+-transporting ATPase